MKIVIAITGASGAIYARQLIEMLLGCDVVEQIAIIVSRRGGEVMAFEGEKVEDNPRIVFFDNDDMFSPVASGSADYDAMVVVPCSMGTLARIATGVSVDLISRAADVMLKERRKLILVTREAPLSLIHIENMGAVTRASGVVIPASPSFYSMPEDVEALCRTVTERIISQLGIDTARYKWQGK